MTSKVPSGSKALWSLGRYPSATRLSRQPNVPALPVAQLAAFVQHIRQVCASISGLLSQFSKSDFPEDSNV